MLVLTKAARSPVACASVLQLVPVEFVLMQLLPPRLPICRHALVRSQIFALCLELLGWFNEEQFK